ncbi:MAG: type II toxin-antitoxin system YafQ family toxin [Bacillota bacterium]
MKLDIKFTSQFKKDLKLAKKQNKPIDELFDVIEQLANQESLSLHYKDHALIGKYSGYRECHIEPDWLLIYTTKNDILTLVLYRLGSHSDLF